MSLGKDPGGGGAEAGHERGDAEVIGRVDQGRCGTVGDCGEEVLSYSLDVEVRAGVAEVCDFLDCRSPWRSGARGWCPGAH